MDTYNKVCQREKEIEMMKRSCYLKRWKEWRCRKDWDKAEKKYHVHSSIKAKNKLVMVYDLAKKGMKEWK